MIKPLSYNVFCIPSRITFNEYLRLTDGNSNIELYCVNLSQYVTFVPRLKLFLNTEESSRANRYYYIPDQNRFIICRAILKFILSKHIGLHIRDIFFDIDDNKKPYLRGYDSIFFNVTHASDYAIIAIAKSPIGVDIEYINKEFDYKEILPNTFNKSEIEEINNGDDKHVAFYKLWTRKESIVKATGKGIDDTISEIISLDGYHHVRSELMGNIKNLQVLSFDLSEGYLGSLAFETSKFKNKLSFSTLPIPISLQEIFNTIT